VSEIDGAEIIDRLVRLLDEVGPATPLPERVVVSREILEQLKRRATVASGHTLPAGMVGTLYGIPLEVDETLTAGQWRVQRQGESNLERAVVGYLEARGYTVTPPGGER
jgi:hypothetical protein